MFLHLQNKYATWYFELCRSRQHLGRRPGYLERHHIWPTKMGGPNTPENTVLLTAREHFIAHVLLTKMLEGEHKRKMCYALSFFRTGNRNFQRNLTARQYEVARKALSTARKGVSPSPQCIEAVRKAKKGVPLSPEQRRKMGEKLKVKHEFFMFDEHAGYRRLPDFYRYCDETGIGRANLQAKMKIGRGVITTGKFKGQVFSFTDIGEQACIELRDLVLAEAITRRTNSTHQQWRDRRARLVLK